MQSSYKRDAVGAAVVEQIERMFAAVLRALARTHRDQGHGCVPSASRAAGQRAQSMEKISNSPLARKFAGRFDAIVPGIRASATTRGKSRREADIGQAVRMNLDL
jgi:hypothetical protein